MMDRRAFLKLLGGGAATTAAVTAAELAPTRPEPAAAPEPEPVAPTSELTSANGGWVRIAETRGPLATFWAAEPILRGDIVVAVDAETVRRVRMDGDDLGPVVGVAMTDGERSVTVAIHVDSGLGMDAHWVAMADWCRANPGKRPT